MDESKADELKKKDEIIKHLAGKIDQIENSLIKFKDVELKLKNKDDLINNLNRSLSLKEDQIKTIKDSLDLKNEQINTFEISIRVKDEKIKALEKSLELKQKQLSSLESSSVDKNLLQEKDDEIETLNEKVRALGEEIKLLDEDLEALENENENLRNELSSSSGSKIVDWTNIHIPKSDILEKMRDIIMKALHNLTIAVPNIKDLQQLYLYEVRATISMKISCSIDPSLEEDAELLEEFESMDNISIRLYEGEDRFVLDRDGEELLLVIRGNDEDNNLVIHTKDPKHIRFLSALTMESWLRSRKIE
jgi:chromosome segregation ATPase